LQLNKLYLPALLLYNGQIQGILDTSSTLLIN